jgi:TatD DNase family protein
MLVDTHCHLDRLDLTPYNGDLSLPIEKAKEYDVNYILCVCIEMEHFSTVLKIAETYPNVSASVGLHPTECEGHDPSIEELVTLASHPKVIAIGETGLDYYRIEGELEWQRERFRRHIRAAKKIKKPIIVHTRNARADTLAIMKEEGADEISGVMHCFTEDWGTAKKAIELGFYISFSGIVTFKNAKELKEVVKQVPLNKMLIETDSPYLAPMPFRGKSNEPAYVQYVAKCIAELHNVSYEEVALQTTNNYFTLFKDAQRL